MQSGKGIVLMNLGSPDSPTVPDVRRYLREFLMDGRVIDYPYLFRFLLVNGIIVPFRASKSAHAYRSIWWKEGSPLLVLSEQLKQALQEKVAWPVTIAMRYGNPHPRRALEELKSQDPYLEEVILIPLYPHYAMSSYETAVEYMKEAWRRGGYPFRLTTLRPFYDRPEYIGALAESMRPRLANGYDHLLFSYHGLPERHIRKSDPTRGHCLSSAACCEIPSPSHPFCYRHQCLQTTRQLALALNLPQGKFSNSFQSRLGKGWLQPFTDIRLRELASQGVKRLLVVCPAFVSDCLETLEEIAERGKETFLAAGGASYEMIPCLNTDPAWVETLASWIRSIAAGQSELTLP